MDYFSAFEIYCTNQVFASTTLGDLCKNNKKFRDFLNVSLFL